MRGSEEFAGCGEGEGGTGAFDVEGIDEMAGRKIPHADDGIHGGGNDPATIVGEAEVADFADAAPEFAHEASGFDVDDADGEVVAAEG